MTDTVPEAITSEREQIADSIRCYHRSFRRSYPGGRSDFRHEGEYAAADAIIARRLASQDAGEGLREALAPFVRHWQPWMDDTDATDDGSYNYPDDAPMSCFARVTYGDIRRARAILSPPSDAGSTTREGGEGDEPCSCILSERTGEPIGGACPACVAALATTPSPDASPDSGEGEWITLRSLESDPRHLVVEAGGREVINTYFADGPVYHTAHQSPEAPANRQEAGEGQWHPKIGEEVRTTEAVHERFGEWRGVQLWVAEVRAERGRGERLNVTVTEEWPMTKAASLTDAFYVGGNGPDDLAPALATTSSPDASPDSGATDLDASTRSPRLGG